MKEPEEYIREITNWASSCDTIRTIALLGSYARKEARPDSDIDFLFLCDDKAILLKDLSWIKQFGEVASQSQEQWGIVTSVRVFYRDGREIEFGLAPLNWAEITFGDRIPPDISERIKILKDKDDIMVKFKRS